MQVILAKNAGFCMGVSLALKKLDATIIAKPNKKIVTFGPIIHNPQVLEEYAQKGVFCLNSVDEIDSNSCVIIRAHGIPQDIEKEIREKGAEIIDATCPKVKQAQLAIQRTCAKNKHLLLYGEPEHPEVQGLISYANSNYNVFSNLEELFSLELNPNLAYVLAAQTTQSKDTFLQIKEFLASKVRVQSLNTICDATKERQDEVVDLAKKVDAFVVVGGKNSGNTKRLAEIATRCDKKVLFIESPEQIDKSFFSKNMQIALTAGASTPKSIIMQTKSILEQME